MTTTSMRTAAVLVAALVAAVCGAAPRDDSTSQGAAPQGTAPQDPAPQAAAPVPKVLPEILARVNDDSVNRWEVEAAVREIELANVHPIPARERDEIIRTVLDRIIGHHLIVQEARARNLRVSDAVVDAEISQMRKEFSTEKAFEDALASYRTSLDQLRSQRRLSLEIAQFVRTTIAPAVSVAEAQIEEYYRGNPERFHEPESVLASHILIPAPPDATPEQRATARATADDLLARLRRGADFGELARQYSKDSRSASNGGDLAAFARGQMDPTFEDAAFAIESNGGLSDVVETGIGFHLIRVKEHRAARTASLDEARAAIRELLLDRVQQEKLSALIEQARAKARIEIFI